jgi:hypothetical protein
LHHEGPGRNAVLDRPRRCLGHFALTRTARTRVQSRSSRNRERSRLSRLETYAPTSMWAPI